MTRPNRTLLLTAVALTAGAALPQRLPRWRQVPDLTARYGAAAAYDEARGRIVMFGGSPIISGPAMSLDDTWEWDGTRWLPRHPRTVPQPRHGAAMTFDPVRRKVVMFGGVNHDTVTALAETWEWDGEDWRQLTPANSPPPLLVPSLATDPLRGRIVLFGGKTQIAHPGPWLCLDDTWEWDGTDWALMQPIHRPSPRYAAGFAYCAQTSTAVLYGGSNTTGGLIGDRLTWEWDGNDWRSTSAFPTDPPSGARGAPAMVPLPWSGNVLMFGESSTWQWNGSTWAFVQSTGGAGELPLLGSPAYAADRARQQVVCFSGFGSTTAGLPRVTWTFDQSMSWRAAYDSFQLWMPYQAVQYDPARDEYLFLQWDDQVLARPMRTYRMRGATLESEMEEYPGVTQVPWRDYGGMCFDPDSGKMLLFGGERGAILQDDTWLWDGTDWTSPNYAVHPPPGRGAPVYDSRRRRIVMPMVLARQQFETWEWTDAGGWRPLPHPPAIPYAHDFVRAAYDPASDRVVVVAWQTPPNQATSVHTWTFDGSVWQEHVNATALPRFVNNVLHIPELGGVVAFVIQDTYLNDPYQVWLWTGSDWQRIQTANFPGGERVPSLGGIGPHYRVFGGLPLYDSSRGKVRLFMSRGPGWFCEDLILDRLAASSHGPSIGSTWTARFDDPSQAGHAFAIALSGSDWPALPIRFRPSLGVFERFPLGDDPLFRASAAAGLGIGLLDAQGRGSFSLQLPNHQALVGYRFHAAALTIDPALPSLGVISNPVTVEIQR